MRVGTLAIPRPRAVRVRRAVGVPGDWLTPPVAEPGALLYLHGGGYVVGSARTHRSLAARLAVGLSLRALVLDYRRAPEHRHPAALEDSLDAYRLLLGDGIAPSRIAVVGDSAGAGLALALASQARDAGLPQPAVLGLICPWLDVASDVHGARAPAPREPILSPELLASWARAYVGELEPSSPAISPLNGDLRRLAPIVMQSAGDDLLETDAERLAGRAAVGAGHLAVEHQSYPGLWHDFQLFAGLLAGAEEAVAALGTALRGHLGEI